MQKETSNVPINQLNESNDDKCLQALLAVSQNESNNSESVIKILEQIRRKNVSVTSAVHGILTSFGENSLSPLISTLKDEKQVDLHECCLCVIGNIKHSSKLAIPIITSIAIDSNIPTSLRRIAIITLGKISRSLFKDLPKTFEALLGDPNDEIKFFSALEILKVDSNSKIAVACLERVLCHSPIEKYVCALNFNYLPIHIAVTISDLLTSEDRRVRICAAKVLLKSDEFAEKSIATLISEINSDDFEMRQSAILSIDFECLSRRLIGRVLTAVDQSKFDDVRCWRIWIEQCRVRTQFNPWKFGDRLLISLDFPPRSATS